MTVPYHEGNVVLQTIRATSNYGNGKSKPRFDHCKATVYRSRGATSGQLTECTVQVRALFWCSINGTTHPFAFVYEMKEEAVINNAYRTVLDEFGCTAFASLPKALPDECPNGYKVLPLSGLQRRVDLCPPLYEGGKYRFNSFSWQARKGYRSNYLLLVSNRATPKGNWLHTYFLHFLFIFYFFGKNKI